MKKKLKYTISLMQVVDLNIEDFEIKDLKVYTYLLTIYDVLW